MIPIESYSKEFEQEYLKAVKKKIDSNDITKIIDSCKKFFPKEFILTNDEKFFESIILYSFEKLVSIKEYIDSNKTSKDRMNQEIFYTKDNGESAITELYQKLYDLYEPLANSKKDYETIRVRIVKNLKLTVCPYCNRDYINCRAKDVSGAQLDHFFNRSCFPLFSICLYNLIPVCGNCNRVKGAINKIFVSPFDKNINWKEDITFSYIERSLNDIEIILKTNGNMKNNIESMKIAEVYQIHKNEVLELIEREKIYNHSQSEEFKDVFSKVGLTDLEIKNLIFGSEITENCMKTKPLGKMMSDLHKELNIYKSI